MDKSASFLSPTRSSPMSMGRELLQAEPSLQGERSPQRKPCTRTREGRDTHMRFAPACLPSHACVWRSRSGCGEGASAPGDSGAIGPLPAGPRPRPPHRRPQEGPTTRSGGPTLSVTPSYSVHVLGHARPVVRLQPVSGVNRRTHHETQNAFLLAQSPES